jgi:uncharacterized MAPEG superfamily protein
MTTEILVLILAALLQMVQMIIPGYFQSQTAEGLAWNASPRDTPRTPGIPEARAQRAFENHDRNLLLFAIAALAITVNGEGTWWTGLLAWIYLLARIAYVPAYIQGWSPGRSAIWAVGYAAVGLMLLAALF